MEVYYTEPDLLKKKGRMQADTIERSMAQTQGLTP